MLPDTTLALAGRRIAVPESRLLDVLEGLLLRRGADVMRCPLVYIVDAPDAGAIETWLRDFVAKPPSTFILLTGEGVLRLRGFAQSFGISDADVKAALEQTVLVSRGPKPARELRKLQLAPQHYAATPTTDGVIETLDGLDIAGKRIAVQLYGDDPNRKLVDYLRGRGALVSTVSPYRYAPQLSEEGIDKLIASLASSHLDAIVFTSKAQVHRLFETAATKGNPEVLKSGLARTVVAAVGPVVADVLGEFGCDVHVMPKERYFMKPLVNALCENFQG